MESEDVIFTEISSQNSDKLTDLREGSQVSHINRIRFAAVKRNGMVTQKVNLKQPKTHYKRSSNTKKEQSQVSHINRIRFAAEKRNKMVAPKLNLKRRKRHNRSSKVKGEMGHSAGISSNQNDINGSILGEDKKRNRFLTLQVNDTYSKSSGNFDKNGPDASDGNGGTYLISATNDSKNLKSIRDGSNKRRKQWSKTTETTLDAVVMAEKGNVAERKAGDGFSQKSLSVENVQRFNNIQNQRNEKSGEKRMLSGSSVVKDANVAEWIDNLPSPNVTERILHEVQDGIIDKRRGKRTKCSKVFLKKGFKESGEAIGENGILSKRLKVKKVKKNAALEKTEPSTRIRKKTKKVSPIKVTYTSQGNLKVVICLKKLKRKDTGIIVRFDDLKNKGGNDRTSLGEPKKGFVFLNNQQMGCLDNFLKK